MKFQRQHSAAPSCRMAVVGVFDDPLLVDEAVTELSNAGFSEDHIAIARHPTRGLGGQVAAERDPHAGAHALAGSESAAIPGMSVLASVIPLFGPKIAAGTSSAVTAASAAVAGLVTALVGAGVPEHEARYCRDEFEAGRTIVTVASVGRSREAKAILRRHGAYDMISGILSREATR